MRRFFAEQQTTRALPWFAHFNREPVRGGFPHGAGALARYALLERDSTWQHLKWQGRHAQTPVVVSAKPHYFRELDMVRPDTRKFTSSRVL